MAVCIRYKGDEIQDAFKNDDLSRVVEYFLAEVKMYPKHEINIEYTSEEKEQCIINRKEVIKDMDKKGYRLVEDFVSGLIFINRIDIEDVEFVSIKEIKEYK